jgi:predicted transcriptional regulator
MGMVDERVLECYRKRGTCETIEEIVGECNLDYKLYEVVQAVGRLLEYRLISYDQDTKKAEITERGERYLAGELDLRAESD